MMRFGSHLVAQSVHSKITGQNNLWLWVSGDYITYTPDFLLVVVVVVVENCNNSVNNFSNRPCQPLCILYIMRSQTVIEHSPPTQVHNTHTHIYTIVCNIQLHYS